MVRMLSIIVIFSLFFIISSCKREDKVKETYFQSGKTQYKYFFHKNRLDSVYEYFEHPHKLKSITKTLSDSAQHILIFEKSGKKKSEGNTIFKNGRYIQNGWWEENYEEGFSKIEYLPIGDSVEINQSINYNRDNQIDVDNSLFYNIDLPDTIEYGKEYIFNVELISRIGNEKDFIAKLKISDEISSSFTNIKKAKSNYDIREIKMNHWQVSHTFDRKGSKTLKGGIYVRISWAEDINKDSVRFNEFEKVLYIRKNVFVR